MNEYNIWRVAPKNKVSWIDGRAEGDTPADALRRALERDAGYRLDSRLYNNGDKVIVAVRDRRAGLSMTEQAGVFEITLPAPALSFKEVF